MRVAGGKPAGDDRGVTVVDLEKFGQPERQRRDDQHRDRARHDGPGAEFEGPADDKVRRQHDNAQGHQQMDVAQPFFPGVRNAEHVADDQPQENRVPDEIGVEHLKKGLMIDRPDHAVEPVKQVRQRKGVGYARKIVAEDGDVQHRQQPGQHLAKGIQRAEKGSAVQIVGSGCGSGHGVFLV